MTQRTCSIDGCEKPSKTRDMCGMHVERVKRNGDPFIQLIVRGDDVARFWRSVDKAGPHECWLWLGTKINGGYGQFRAGGRRVMAHRYAYELLVGPIPDDLPLDHVRARGCTNRDCVNPAHLEPVTDLVNTLRSDGPAAINARKTTCDRGHEFDRVILKPNGRTRRRCTICHAIASKASRERAKARRAARAKA